MTQEEQERIALFKGTDIFLLFEQLEIPSDEKLDTLSDWVNGIQLLTSSGFFLALEKKTKFDALEQFLAIETSNASCEIIRVQSFVHAMKTFTSYGEDIENILKGESQ